MTKKIKSPKRKILVIGTGGHARVVLSLLEEMDGFQIVGLLDKKTIRPGERIFGYPIVGKTSDMKRFYAQGIRQVALAIGDNRDRQAMSKQCRKAGFLFPALIHPTATVDRHARIAEGAQICMRAVIGAGAEISQGCIINTASTVDHESKIGAFSHVAPGCGVAGRVVIGEGVFLGIGTQVIDKLHIGSWTTVGAGSVVVDDLPGHVTAYGRPAKVKNS